MSHRLLSLFIATLSVFAAPTVEAKDVQGRIQIQQADGLVPVTGDGTIVFRVRQPGHETTSVEAKVTAGAFLASLPDNCTMQVLVTRTDEGAGYPLDGGRWVPVPEDGEYNLVVRVPLDFILRVYAADGRTELTNITVMRKLRKFARLAIPGVPNRKTQLIHTDVDSPIPFSVPEPEYYTYYVYAPGHAWTQISPDPFLGGVQTMLLPAGGVLNVNLIQAGTGRGRVFRIRDLNPKPDTHPLVHELKKYDNRIEVKGLAVGEYHISSEDPIRPTNMPVYGAMKVEIQAGQTLNLELPLLAEPHFVPVPAAGSVQIPAGWGSVEDLTFRMKRLDPYGKWGRSFEVSGSEFQPIAGQETYYSWKIPEVAPGAYNLSFAHTSYSVYREIYGNGHLRLDYVLPAPRTVEIKTLDDRTGEAIYPDTLTWSALEPAAIKKKIRDTAPFLSERRRLTRIDDAPYFVIYGPDADLRVRLDDPRFDSTELIVKERGDCRQEWKLHRATALRITLLHGEQSIQWTGDARILSEDSDGKVTGARELGKSTQFNLSAPGRYSIRFPELRGFQPIPPQTVQVDDAQIVEIEVALTLK